ncbi:MAG: phosphate ABC transporter permease subunit PstC [Fimbriimonadaceae bacterium]|nr:phosphate ABC transporter permease subunit PstC [Fimbriimonadaceae bacterium]
MGGASEPTLGPARPPAFAAKRWDTRRLSEGVARGACFLCALACVLSTVGIVFVLAREAFVFFQAHSPVSFLTGTTWTPAAEPAQYGVLPLVCGTLLVTAVSALVSVPLGLLVGVYLAEYAPFNVRRVLKPALELLAGIPSVVFGYLGLNLVTPVLQTVFPEISSTNALSGGIVVGIMALPLVASLCQDAVAAVPKAMREAAYGLGSTKAEVTAKIVIPSALSGIVAAFILAVSRAIGETMAVTIAAGATPKLTLNPAEEIQTMTAYIVNVSKGDASRGSPEYQTIFAVGITLFIMTLVMNLVAQKLVRRFRRGYA